PLRRDVERPRKSQGDWKSDEHQQNHKAQRPVWQFPCRKGRRSQLDNAAGSNDVSRRHSINFAPFYLLEEAGHNNRSGFVRIIVQRRKYRHEIDTRRSLCAGDRSLSNSARDPIVSSVPLGSENEKSPSSFCSVPIDQGLKTGIISQRIPHRIKCEEGNCDSIGSTQRTVNKVKRLIGFACPGVDLSERNSHLWPIKGILRFGQKLDGASAFGDSPVLLTKPSQNHAEDYVP